MDGSSTLESVDVQQFLTNFAETFNNNKPELAATFCLLPSIIIGDHNKTVLNSQKALQAIFSRFIRRLHAKGIVNFVPEVNQTMRLSDSLLFTNIRWQLFDKEGQLQVNGSSSYTMQLMPDQQLKIIITVIDDEEKQLEKMFPLSKRL
ncbi:hypothetical protein [Paraglaciecola hydrolytica]|uniref:SnoaL-like domain-containing protein n=1 Tax=Paraglaciecola hydrolytica TaxID=1799789 RepID=A0A136A0C2_9ALTE|nr:hypothetical protein [Paraglaciecola hydrolytica]KXI28662.1 hypothetical protein AX660_16430 [Paraglaciecola hydrolytica]